MKYRPSDMEEISLKDKVRGTMLKEWGRMCRSGMGLGYGSCTLNDGRGAELPLSIEQFTQINDAVNALPIRPKTVITHVYKLENSIRETALKLGDTRDNVDRHHKEGVTMLYAVLCLGYLQLKAM